MKRAALLVALALAAPLAAQEKGQVVEEIIARVNNEIITRADLQRARAALQDEVRQDCPRCTPEQLQAMMAERDKNLLRDLIDQSLLTQRAKDMGISVEADVIKRLDQIRTQNNLPDLESLEKAVASQGLNFEEFKNNIRNSLLTQRVINSEVGSRISVGQDEIEKYYAEHQKEFVRPEQVVLRGMFFNTEGKKDADIAELEKKATGIIERVHNGEDFGELAKRYSDDVSKSNGGHLGSFERGKLSKELEDAVFRLKKNEMTGVIHRKQDIVVLQVLEHYDAGEQPLAKVKEEIAERLYSQRMDPAYRHYLKTLREESYVVVKPGYADSAGAAGSPIQEVAATPEVSKTRKGRKKFLLFGKRKASGA